MTEADWLAATDPEPMIWLARKRGSDRRTRLAACACYRAVWEAAGDRPFEWVIEAGERLSDGEISPEAAGVTFGQATDAACALMGLTSLQDVPSLNGRDLREVQTATLMLETAMCVSPRSSAPLSQLVREEPTRLQRLSSAIADWLSLGEHDRPDPKPPVWCLLIRCVFGNPFQPVAFDPRWRTETAASLASAIYTERAFDRMPILADALEEAGCNHTDVLSHCRGPGPHVRGCWVIDLLLGKS